jgi:hypothetical protein
MSFMNNGLVTYDGTKNEVYDIFKNNEFLHLKNTCFHMRPETLQLSPLNLRYNWFIEVIF